MRRQSIKRLTHRSAITNGTKLLPEVDGRSAPARRYRDLVSLHSSDLGGDNIISEGQRALVQRAAYQQVMLEQLEQQFVQQGGPSTADLERYQRGTNTLRRTLQCLGLHRGRVAARDRTPDLDSYLSQRRPNGHARPSSRIRIDRMERDG